MSDNDSRETIESWEACFAEGVRTEEVVGEVPPLIQQLHEASLTQGRDVLAAAPESDKEKWMAKDGTDWSVAFGKDPVEMFGHRGDGKDGHSDAEDEDEDGDSSTVDLGVTDASTEDGSTGLSPMSSRGDSSQGVRESMDSTISGGGELQKTSSGSSKNPIKQYKDYKGRSRDLHRKHTGLMQW